MHPKTPAPIEKNVTAALLALPGLAGFAAAIFVLRTRSETASAVLWGYSTLRLAMAAALLGLAAAAMILSLGALRQAGWWRRPAARLEAYFASPARAFAELAVLFAALLAIAALLALSVSAAANELTLLKTVRGTLGAPLVWGALVCLVAGALILLHRPRPVEWAAFFTPLRLALLFLILTAAYAAALKIYMTLTWDIRMRRLEEYIFLPALIFLLWGVLRASFRERKWYAAAERILLLAAVWVVTYAVYRHTAQWMEWQHTPSKTYWHELADAFLHGRLYLINPEFTHDLTFYQGNWYVPNPPLPAFIVMPFVALFGAAQVNMVLFSIVLGATNVVLLYLILAKSAQLGLIPTGRGANLLLTALAAFGTTHWWLAVMGRMWFISQLLTLGFSALALLAVLYRRSPWWAGIGLGLAVMSRPNVFTLWPFLAGLALYFMRQEADRISWKRFVAWAVQSALPVVLAAAGLLVYNYMRFDDFLDFGYVTINTAEWLTEAVTTYGMFNAHFVPANLYAMFAKLPILEMRGGCLYYSPTHEGISMLAMTPALIYIFRRFKVNLWTASAWLSIVLSLGLLVFYHNTGAWQLGYRYLMDFILPVMLLLAIGIGRRPAWLFHALVVLSVLGNAAGIVWWFGKWGC